MKNINVLQFICPAGLFGAEMWILALAKNLDKQKITCHLAVTHEDQNQNLEILKRYKALDLPTHKISMQGRFDPSVIINLVKLIQREKIDIIHTHGYKSDIIGLIAAKISGIKAVATPHGFENVDDIKLQMFIRLGCVSFRFFNAVAPLSEALKDDVLSLKVKPDKTILIINGVDLDEVDRDTDKKKCSNLPVNATEKRIGYVGQMAYRKKVGDLLLTFDLLFKEHKNIRLYLIGDGPMRKELEHSASLLKSSKQIEFLGYRSDRLNIVKSLDLFSMTSSLEGIPRCMMEAMAIGIPVAAYDIPGVDNLIDHGKTGLLANPGDIGGLKECWETLLFDESQSRSMARAGRSLVRDRFSGKRMAGEYTKLFQNMI